MNSGTYKHQLHDKHRFMKQNPGSHQKEDLMLLVTCFLGPALSSAAIGLECQGTHGVWLSSLRITLKTLMSHQHMLLTWLLPQKIYHLQIQFCSCGHIVFLRSRDHDRNGGILYRVGISLWIVVVDHRASSCGPWWWQWIMTMDCGSWWHLIVVAADHGLWLQQDCLIYNMFTQIPLLTITPQFIYLHYGTHCLF